MLLLGTTGPWMAKRASAQASDILWAHGAAAPLFTSILASKRNRMVIAGDEVSRYWMCTLPPVSVSSIGEWGGSIGLFLDRDDSELLVTEDSMVYSVNVSTRSYTPVFAAGTNSIRYLSATSDGNLIAVQTEEDWLLHLYDRSQGRLVATWPNCSSPSAFSPDGKLLVTGFKDSDADHGLAVIDVATHAVVHRYSMRLASYEPYEIVGAIKFSPVEPGVFAVVNQDNVLEMDTSGKILAHWPAGTSVGDDVFDYSPDGSTIAVATTGNIVLLHPSDGSYSTLPGGAQYVAFLDNDTLAATNDEDVYLFSTKQDKYLGQLNATQGAGSTLQYSADGTKLFDGFDLFDAATGDILFTNSKGGSYFAASPDFTRMVSSGGDGTLRLYRNLSDTGRIIPGTTYRSDTEFSTLLAFSPNDSVFATAGDLYEDTLYPDSRNTVRLRSGLDGSMIREFPSPLYPVINLTFSHDGSMLAALIDSIYVWNVKNGQLIAVLGKEEGQHFIGNINFLPGDSTILLGTVDSTYGVDRIRDDSTYFVSTSSTANYGTLVSYADGQHYAEIPFGNDEYFEVTNLNFNDSSVNVVDMTTGASQLLTAPGNWDKSNGEWMRSIAVNPVTGDIAATGGLGSVYVWKNPFATDRVKVQPAIQTQPLQAFASNSSITIDMPSGVDRGKVFVYRSDGRCYFTAEVAAGDPSITTSALPMGDYFIVFQTASGGKYFTKVSLFE